jgi:hypothetical protein
MNIEDLTFKQIKELLSLLVGETVKPHPMIGKFCIARCYSAGVHAGYVVSVDKDTAILKDSRRLWSWKGTGVALSGVANGKLIEGKLDTVNPEIYLTGVIELIPCTTESRDSIYEK